MKFTLKVDMVAADKIQKDSGWTSRRKIDEFLYYRVPVGLRIVRQVRAELGMEMFPIESIPGEVQSTEYPFSLEIGEDIAESSGLFEDVNEVTIELERDIMDRYVGIEVHSDIGREGQVTVRRLTHALNECLFIEDWKVHGFPLVWKQPDADDESGQ